MFQNAIINSLVVDNVLICVSEGMQNAVRYGESEPIMIEFCCSDTEVSILIVNRGSGFNLDNELTAETQDYGFTLYDDKKTLHRGLMLMKSASSEINVYQNDNGCNLKVSVLL